jgi:hypothetical protein
MTDYEETKTLFTKLGIGFEEDETAQGKPILTLAEGSTKIRGYGGFYCNFEFKEDGSFEEVSVWE